MYIKIQKDRQGSISTYSINNFGLSILKRITVNMQDICHHKLSVFAAYTQKSINSVVNDALKAHIQNHPSYQIIANDLLQGGSDPSDCS